MEISVSDVVSSPEKQGCVKIICLLLIPASEEFSFPELYVKECGSISFFESTHTAHCIKLWCKKGASWGFLSPGCRLLPSCPRKLLSNHIQGLTEHEQRARKDHRKIFIEFYTSSRNSTLNSDGSNTFFLI